MGGSSHMFVEAIKEAGIVELKEGRTELLQDQGEDHVLR